WLVPESPLPTNTNEPNHRHTKGPLPENPAVDTRAMKKTLRTSILAITLASAGCVALPTQPRLAASNPASPNAPEAAFPLAAPLLMTGNNYAMAPEGEG